jgi:hypothetical protein
MSIHLVQMEELLVLYTVHECIPCRSWQRDNHFWLLHRCRLITGYHRTPVTVRRAKACC